MYNYNDFVHDPREFIKTNVLCHYPVNHDWLVIGRFCLLACGAIFLLKNGGRSSEYKKAVLSDVDIVKMIAGTTISEVYFHYYPEGAVEYFRSHHREQNIAGDIEGNRVFSAWIRIRRWWGL